VVPLTAQFPEALQCLFQPKRYKVLYGGRGAGRSWGVGRRLLLLGVERRLRWLCARELQKSISESVLQLLSDQIKELGLEQFYEVQSNRIIGPYGGFFVFEGIRNNIQKIKSYEGLDGVWVEEANKVPKSSWDDLIPTIRKDGSEIWMTFNPELATDYTYRWFVTEAKKRYLRDIPGGFETPDSFVVKMTWRDNPWFPKELAKERDKLRETDMDSYLNVYEGNCREALEGAVFAKELRQVTAEGRICRVPWDRETPVDTFWDLGRRDMTSIWFAQRVGMQWRVLRYFEGSQEDIHYYLRQLQHFGYTYGICYLPHDARNKLLGAKRSIEQIVRDSGQRVQIVQRVNKKVNAINAARIIFPNCWFDEANCAEGLERLRHYRYNVVEGQLSEEPLHDDNSNGADAFMTLAQAIKSPRRQRNIDEKLGRPKNDFVQTAPGLGWMN
jgi:phage terminase large subunit